ncbi:MAG TPA: class I SAM-dependent methyltransferase [Bryobacteraceae bacterium]|nr:class I SAM-dependent methyltransferase [Bryobacteraceae bacterium]
MLFRLMAALHGPVYAARQRELVRLISPHLVSGDRVVDVGCGYGNLGKALMDHSSVVVTGLERVKRPGASIPVEEYSGRTLPLADLSVDVAILADVLHHDDDPKALLAECLRISRRLVVIKDHILSGPLAHARVSLLDWAANVPYGVKCTYSYNTPEQWRHWISELGVAVVEERTSLNLYPWAINLVFGGRLHYFAVLKKSSTRKYGAPDGLERSA